MRHTARFLATGSIAFIAAVGLAVADKPLERFTAFAVDLSNMAGPRTGTVDIAINRWSTDQERDQLLAALREGGSDSLLRALQKIKEPVGYIRSPNSIGYPLRFARQLPLPDGGRRVIIATDRPVSFLEIQAQARTIEYPFMLIELRVTAKGEGEGKLMPLAKITANEDHVVEIENYASEPVRLTQVRKEK